jgi:hypothetical protein
VVLRMRMTVTMVGRAPIPTRRSILALGRAELTRRTAVLPRRRTELLRWRGTTIASILLRGRGVVPTLIALGFLLVTALVALRRGVVPLALVVHLALVVSLALVSLIIRRLARRLVSRLLVRLRRLGRVALVILAQTLVELLQARCDGVGVRFVDVELAPGVLATRPEALLPGLLSAATQALLTILPDTRS